VASRLGKKLRDSLKTASTVDTLAGAYQASGMHMASIWRSLLGLLSASLALGACAPHVVSSPASGVQRGVIVSGVGKAHAKPNIARTTIEVEARAATAEQAIADVNTRMAQVIAAVKQAGVASADVRTSNLSLNFERVYEEPPRPIESPAPAVAPAPPGKVKPASAPAEAPVAVVAPPPQLPRGFYNASNTVEVTIRKLEDAGKVISAATGAGANQLFGIRFELEDTSALQAEARKKAVADARARAERLAQLTGVKLGPAISINEQEGNYVPSGPIMPMSMKAAMADSAPVEGGEITISTSVQIVYELPQANP
jgi:uncharacterized protein